MKKFICACILVLILLLPVPAYASTNWAVDEGVKGIITPQFTHILLLNAGLSINSSGKATCVGIASTYDASHTTNIIVELEKSTVNGWSTIKTWSASAKGISPARVEADYYVVSGIYRVRSTAKIYNADGVLLESKSTYSDTVKY